MADSSTHAPSQARPRLAFVLWNGNVGGAESLAVAIGTSMRRQGAGVGFVFIGGGGPIAERVQGAHIPYRVLDFAHGRDTVPRCRRFAAAVTAAGPDGAILPECGFIGAALRAGGYRGRIVGVEHGTLLRESALPPWGRAARRASRTAGAWAADAQVAVSDFMLDHLRRAPHTQQLLRIYNGIDPDTFAPQATAGPAGHTVIVGFAGRLVAGKGVDHAIAAIAAAGAASPLRLRIAGDGPERASLTALASKLSVGGRVEFAGVVNDMPRFWRECQVAVFPSDQFVESFGMSALEAMASGLPVVASANGGTPELIDDGASGTIVPRGDESALTRALASYAANPALRGAHGAAARARAIERFHIDACTRHYLACLGGRV